MDLAALEFPAIVDRLAAATGTPRGEELALALEPSCPSGRRPAPPGVDGRGGRAARCVGRARVRRDPGRARSGRAGLARRRARPAGAAGGRLDGRRRPARALRARRGRLAAPVRAGLGDRAGARPARRGDRTDDRRGRLRRPGQRLSPAPQAAQGAARDARARHRGAAAARAAPRAARAPPGGVRRAARRAAGVRGQVELAAQRAGHRPRHLGLRPDAVRRAARGGRALEPALGGVCGRARGGGADPARAVGGRRLPSRRSRRARRGVRRDRPGGRVRSPLAGLARRSRRDRGRGAPGRCTAPVARPGNGRPDRSRPGRCCARS